MKTCAKNPRSIQGIAFYLEQKYTALLNYVIFEKGEKWKLPKKCMILIDRVLFSKKSKINHEHIQKRINEYSSLSIEYWKKAFDRSSLAIIKQNEQ